MNVEQAQANYDAILAQYLEVRARVEAGDSSPDTLAAAQHLYDQSLAAHAALVAAHQEPATAEPAAAEPPATDAAVVGAAVIEPAPVEPAATDAAVVEPAVVDEAATPESAGTAVPAEPVLAEPVLAEPVFTEPASAQPSEFDLTEVARPAPLAPAAGEAPAGAVLGRRTALRRFSPPPAEPEQPLRRDILGGAHSNARSGIGRERKVAGNLPDWDLLPPSEILQAVRR